MGSLWPGRVFTRRSWKQVEMSSEELIRMRRELRRANQRTVLAVVGSALILSAAALMGLDGQPSPLVGGAPLLTWMLGGLGAYMVLAA